MKSKKILGIDIGGSGIKGAPVDIKTGKLAWVNDTGYLPLSLHLPKK